MRGILILSLLFVLCIVSVSGHNHRGPPPPPPYTMEVLQARLAELNNAQATVNVAIQYHLTHPRRLAILQGWSTTNTAEINRITGMINALAAGQPQSGPPFTPVALPAEATLPVAPVPVPVASGYPYNYPYYNYPYGQHHYAAAAAAARAASPPVVGSTTPFGRPIVSHPVTGLPSVQTRGGRFRHVESELDAAEVDAADDADEESNFDEADFDGAEAETDSAFDADDTEDVEQAEVNEVSEAQVDEVSEADVDSVPTPKPAQKTRSMNRHRKHCTHHGAVKVTVNVNSPRHAFHHRRAMK
jgi:hypothetical protein